MKSLIKYAIELDITGLCTFKGYKGGDIIRFECPLSTSLKLKKFCHNLEIDSNIKYDKNDNNKTTIFCSFGEDIYSTSDIDDDGVYDLKL